MKINNHCPICNKDLQPNDKLIAEYFPPRNWWVLKHQTESSPMFCGLAGFQIAGAGENISLAVNADHDSTTQDLTKNRETALGDSGAQP